MPARVHLKKTVEVLAGPVRGYGARSMASIEPFSTEELLRATRVAEGLHAAWTGWLGAFPSDCRSASGLSRGLGIDRTTCQRLVHAVRGGFEGPVLLSRVPGVPGLRRLLEAGAGRVPDGTRAATEEAVEAFASLIDDLGGSQSRLIRRLDATGGDPEIGGGAGDDEGDRQRLFEAAARLTGRWSDLWMAVYLFVPDAERRCMRVPRMYGLLGHRSTPDAVPLVIQNFGSGRVRETDAAAGAGPDPRAAGLVESFSTDADALVRDARGGGLLAQRVDAEPGQAGRPIDLVFSSVGENPHPRLNDPRVANLWAMVHFPARAMLFDAYMPVTEARSSLPSVGVHLWDPGMDLHARPGWRTRFPSGPKLALLGRGLEGAASPLHRRHPELTRLAFESAGVDPDDYVGYRLAVPFPLWRTGYCMSFDFGDGG
ncbi:MAG: hypothetical protein LAT64_09395 [Phycisphaerales bacterium]|nr:hypothetical protein [Planctomycetota bacterium]MCH8508963.1 hypothetical protein [Phycisphaerales bacterium]